MSLQSSSKPIVHIATDEKFIDAAYEIYKKAFPGKNRFVILLDKPQNKVKHLSENISYEFIEIDDYFISKVKDKIHEAKVVMFHEMNYHQTEIALSLLQQEVAIGWTVFGYEVYHNSNLFGRELYGDRTYKRFVQNVFKDIALKIRSYFYKFVLGREDPLHLKIKVMEQMDFVGILYKEELELYKERMAFNDEVQQLKFTYYPLDIVVSETATVTGNNILLGNSASNTNNHLEAFDLLEKLSIGDKKIICPLSYGDEEYASFIQKEGRQVFGSRFEPLTDFLPLKDYQKVLQNCAIVIMNHYRQQAVGNVLNTMYLGAKVYLSNRNTLFHYLNRIGCYIYSIEDDLTPTNKKVLTHLTTEQIQHNRKILKEELSLERICSDLQQKLNPLLN